MLVQRINVALLNSPFALQSHRKHKSHAQLSQINTLGAQSNNANQFTLIQNAFGQSPTGTTLVSGQIGSINTDDLVTLYWEPDLVKDKDGNYVPVAAKSYPNQALSEDSQQELPERWSERSTCGLAIKDGSVLLGASHCGTKPKVVVYGGGDLWQKGNEKDNLKENDYKFFAANNSDLSILVRNTEKGYADAISWLSDIVNDPQIPSDSADLMRQVENNEMGDCGIVTNRLPGTHEETINGQVYEKIRNRSAQGTATLVKGKLLGVTPDDLLITVVPRQGGQNAANVKAAYHGASGSPVSIGKNGMLGVFSARWSGFHAEESPQVKQEMAELLYQKGYLKTKDQAALDQFMQENFVYFITPLTRKTAQKLLQQVKDEYRKLLLKKLTKDYKQNQAA